MSTTYWTAIWLLGYAFLRSLKTLKKTVCHFELLFFIKVLQLMSLTDSRLPQTGCEKLELSMMSFLDHIRKIYIIEQMQKMKIYKRLSELLGINDEPMLLSVINRKM